VTIPLLLSAACTSVLYPRRGLLHYLKKEVAPHAVDCGSFTRPIMESRALSAAEASQVSACITGAYAGGRAFVFSVVGGGIDSTPAWGIIGGPGGIRRFDYDSAPCGGPYCRERFVTAPCPLPPPGEMLDPTDICS
jgi:hypothetical protein